MSVRTKQATKTKQQTKRTPVTSSEEMLNFLVREGGMLAAQQTYKVSVVRNGFSLTKKF